MNKKYRYKINGSPANFLFLAFKHGIHWRYSGRFLLYFLKSILFFPFYFIEWLIYSKAIARTEIIHPPVFILGHHRSGTTLLHKLLVMDAESGYFKNRDIIFPKLKIPGRELVKRFLKGVMKRLKVKSFAYNNVLFDLDDPQEEDMCIAGMLDRQSFYWAFVFPKTATYSFDELVQYKRSSMGQKWKENYLYHLKRLQYFNKDKRLVLKNPPNTARLKHILDLFPNARIIYIYRNPSDVIYSVRRLWEKGLTAFSLQSFDESMIEDKIFAYYKKFHDAYRTERNLIPPDHLVEIRYEELETDPLSVIKEIYHHFNWNMEGSIARIQDKINEEKKYMKFSYRKDEVLDRRIVQELKEYFEEEEVACFNNSIQ